MHLFVDNETTALEKRVALTPDVLQRLLKKHPGLHVQVATGAGAAAGFPDAAYTAAGATILAGNQTETALAKADLHARIAAPTKVLRLKSHALLISLNPQQTRGHANSLTLEKLPRTSRAQALDVLSSQANIAGYAAVLRASQYFPRLLPMFMTAAGSSRPANVLVLGVGVAGLQAIATARRLGAQVFAYDIRPEVQEQILSLGAKPVLTSTATDDGAGGYAKELSKAEQAAQQGALAGAIAAADVIITTAQVPGRPAPVLVSEAAVTTMKPGSVLLDMAAGGYNQANNIKGGNCPLSRADDVITTPGAVTLLAPTNLPAAVPGDASRFFAQNLVNLLALLLKTDNGTLTLDFSDELITAMHTTPSAAAANVSPAPAAKPAKKIKSR